MRDPKLKIASTLPISTLILALLLALSLAGLALAADDAAEDPVAARHKAFLEWETGEWDAVITMPDPAGGEPRRYLGEQTDRFSGCGQWLVTELVMVAGEDGEEPPPYEGHGVLGFDPAKQRLTGIWADSRIDWLAVAEGTVDAEGKTLTLEVEGRDPATGEPQTWKFVTTRVGPDRRRLEVLVPVPGSDPLPAAVIESTRR